MVWMCPRFSRLASLGGSAGLGLFFGLKYTGERGTSAPCPAQQRRRERASGATVLARFVSLALFGLALSIPLIAVVLFASAQRGLDWVAGLSRRLPFWTGLLFIVLGMWSIVFGLFARVSHR